MDINEIVKKFRADKVDDDEAHRALNKMVAVVFARMLLHSMKAIRIPHDYDENISYTDIAVRFNPDKSVTLLPGQVLQLTEIDLEKIEMYGAKIGSDAQTVADIKAFNGWIDTASVMPPCEEWVLCISQYTEKQVPLIAALKEVNGKKIFFTNYKINGTWTHFEIDNITHWQPIPFPPPLEEVSKPEAIKKHMPFTEARKSKKKKKRRR